MIKVENIDVYGFEAAIRGMRNPKNSWDRSDSRLCERNNDDCHVNPACGCPKDGDFDDDYFCIGHNDLDLMQRLYKAGTEHRKYLRMINVTMDITCHHTWWAEFDTYKVGTVRNSCSKMHKIHIKRFTADDFSHEGIDECGNDVQSVFRMIINELEYLRQMFNETQDKKYWRAIIELLPMGFNIKSTVQMSYETVFNIIRQREHHKVFEWVQFVDILKQLPYVDGISGGDKNG